MIALRHITPGDFEDIKRYVSDPMVSRYLTWEAYTDEGQIKEYLLGASKKISFPDEVLGIVYKGELVGTAHVISRGNGNVQIGFGVISAAWMRGIGTLAFKKVLEYLSCGSWVGHIRRYWCDIHELNVAAIKIVTKEGFQLETKGVEPCRDRYSMTYHNA